MTEEVKKTTIVCRITPNPNEIKCDIYSADGKFIESKIVEKEKLKDIIE